MLLKRVPITTSPRPSHNVIGNVIYFVRGKHTNCDQSCGIVYIVFYLS